MRGLARYYLAVTTALISPPVIFSSSFGKESALCEISDVIKSTNAMQDKRVHHPRPACVAVAVGDLIIMSADGSSMFLFLVEEPIHRTGCLLPANKLEGKSMCPSERLID